jgi:putative heme-binding domain-containing protein
MRSAGTTFVWLAAGLIALVQPASAQHATASDISDGARAFSDNCANCHGPDGNLIAGIDFGRGLLRRDYADAELVGIILNGIPNTPMPASARMSEAQAERIVAYLRDWPEVRRDAGAAGDARSGRRLFFGDGGCADCHAVNGLGARSGPDLSNIGRERKSVELESSVLDPAASVQPTGRSYQLRLANGEIVTGRLLNHDTFTVQLMDNTGHLRSFMKSDLREHGFVGTPMPAYRDRLSSQQIADLVSFMLTLQGPIDE